MGGRKSPWYVVATTTASSAKLEHASHSRSQAERPPQPPGPHEVPLQLGAADHRGGIALGGAHGSNRRLECLAQDPVAPAVTPSPEDVLSDAGDEDAADEHLEILVHPHGSRSEIVSC